MTLSRGALCLLFLAVTLPTGVGCRSGGLSGMKTWWPGQLVEKDDAAAADLAAAPAFDGDIAKPSSKATPYPTTSTPEGYVVPAAGGSAELVQSQPTAAANEAMAASPPVTYGMQPPAIAADLPPDLPATGTPRPSTEAIAEQVGPYQPLAGATAAAGGPSAAPGAFAAAGGMAPGAFPPEQPLGAAPPASAVPQGLPSPADPAGLGSAPSPAFAAAAPTTTPPQPPSAYPAMPPAASGSAFATTPPPTSPPTAGGSAFGQAAEPQAAASSFAPPASSYVSAGVPQGAAGDSPVAGSRFASAAGSGFPAEPLTPPAAVVPGTEPAAAAAAPWQTASAAATASAASAASFGSPASDGMASRFGQPPSQDPLVEPTGSTAPATPSNDGQPATRPGRRPDPMYRPAGTSSYRPAQPIFADDPEPAGPVRMATYEEPVVDPARQ